MPKVSVILTSYNHAKFIKYAIESVLNQTFSDYELIIWDDCSTDNSWEIINSYKDARIKTYRNKQNMRVGNVSRALEVVSGKYIAVHHSDDIWVPEKLEKQVEYLDKNPKIGAVFSLAEIIDDDGAIFTDENHFYSKIFRQENRTRHQWLNRFFYECNCLCHPSVLIRKKCYEEVGYYNKRFAQLPDFDMWIRLCMKYEIHVLQEKLIKYRVLKNEENASGGRPESHRRIRFEFIKILNNYLNIHAKDELMKIFPEVSNVIDEKHLSDPDLIKYAIARLALNAGQIFHRAFATDTLYGLLGQHKIAEKLEKIAGFTHRDFVKLTGESESGTLEAAIRDKDVHIRNLESIIKEKGLTIK
jgi:glycosyltransferase involved in cell wall biosynthesis